MHGMSMVAVPSHMLRLCLIYCFSNRSFSFRNKLAMLLLPSLSGNKQNGTLSVFLCLIIHAQHLPLLGQVLSGQIHSLTLEQLILDTRLSPLQQLLYDFGSVSNHFGANLPYALICDLFIPINQINPDYLPTDGRVISLLKQPSKLLDTDISLFFCRPIPWQVLTVF